MTREQLTVRIIEPDQLETRDLINEPDALECLSKSRAEFLRRVNRRLVTRVYCDGSSTVWDYGPSWAVAVLDEIWDVRYSETGVLSRNTVVIQQLLRHAASNNHARDAVIAATLAGDRVVLRLARQQRSE